MGRVWGVKLFTSSTKEDGSNENEENLTIDNWGLIKSAVTVIVVAKIILYIIRL